MRLRIQRIGIHQAREQEPDQELPRGRLVEPGRQRHRRAIEQLRHDQAQRGLRLSAAPLAAVRPLLPHLPADVITAGQPAVMPVQRELGDPQPAAGRQVDAQGLVVDPDPPAGLLRPRQALLPATGRLARVMRQAEEITSITRPEGRGEPAGQLSSAMQMIGQRVPHPSSVQAVSPHPGQPLRSRRNSPAT